MNFSCDGQALKVFRKYRCHPVYLKGIAQHRWAKLQYFVND